MSTPDPTPSRIEPFQLRVLVALIAVGTLLRGAVIARQSFWYDESVTAILAAASVRDLVTGHIKDLGNPPLHPVVLHLWSMLFGSGDAAMRSFSAVCGVLSIPLVYQVARRLAGARAALVAAAILALSPVHVYFAQEARTYTLVTLLCLLSVDMLLRGMEKPERAWVWLVHCAATFLAIYAHYFAFFVVLAQFIAVLADHRKSRPFLLRYFASLLGAALLYVTWLPAFYEQATTKGNLSRAAETWHLHLLSTPLVFSVGTTLVWKENATTLRLLLAVVAVMSFCVPALVGVFAIRRTRPAARLLLLWLLLPIALPLLVSALLFPFYYVRYGLLASPALYILIAAGLVDLRRSLRITCVAGMAVTSAASLFFYFTTLVKHDWRDAAAFVEANRRPADLVVFDADIGETPYARYGGRDDSRIRLVAAPDIPPDRFYGTPSALGTPFDVTDQLTAGARLWFVFSDPKAGSGEHYKTMFEKGFRLASEHEFRGILVRRYDAPR